MLQMWRTMDKEHAPQCPTSLNILANHCIQRNLFLKCPYRESTPQCDKFFDFGKKCKLFPMGCGKLKMPEKE